MNRNRSENGSGCKYATLLIFFTPGKAVSLFLLNRKSLIRNFGEIWTVFQQLKCEMTMRMQRGISVDPMALWGSEWTRVVHVVPRYRFPGLKQAQDGHITFGQKVRYLLRKRLFVL